MFLEFLVVSFFDINTFCIFSIIHWYPSIQKFVQPTGWMLVWRSSTWQFDLSTWLKDHGRRHWSCCFGREPTWGLAKILLTFALKILWNLKSSNQSMLMKFGTQVVAGEYIQRLCEVPQDTNQTTLWHQRFSKKTDDSTGHGNPAFHHLDLFWSLSWTGFNAQENMDDDYFAQGATLWVWFGWDLICSAMRYCLCQKFAPYVFVIFQSFKVMFLTVLTCSMSQMSIALQLKNADLHRSKCGICCTRSPYPICRTCQPCHLSSLKP